MVTIIALPALLCESVICHFCPCQLTRLLLGIPYDGWVTCIGTPIGNSKLRSIPKGYRKSLQGFDMWISWYLVLDAIYGRDGLLILTGHMEAEEIPKSAIPENMSLETLKSTIQGWIKDSRT